MRIFNETRNVALAENARRTRNFLERGRGLMFTDSLEQGGGLVIDPCNSITMAFMKYPIDVLFLDREGRVLFLYQGIKPWRTGRVVLGARLAVELPEGTIESTGTQVGDQIRFL